MTVSIQIAGQPVSCLEGDSHSVGSDSRCAIQIAGSGVAPRHALLRRVAGRWLIEAAGEQLIRIGDGRPTRLAWLNPGDQIYISTDGPPLVFEPVDTRPPALALPPAKTTRPMADTPVSAEKPPQAPVASTAPSEPSQPLWFAIGGAGLLAAGILLSVLVLKLTGAFHRTPTDQAETKPESTPPALVSASTVPQVPEVPAVESPVSPASPSDQADISAALYVVQVQANGDQQTYRLGTAWAIAPRKLITSGAVAAGIQALRDVASSARVVPVKGKQGLTVRSIRIHPHFESALKDGSAAQTEAEGIRLELEQPSANVSTLTERLIAAEERRFQAFERQTGFDLAVLEVDGLLPNPLPVTKTADRLLKVGNRVRLVGAPFHQDDFIVDPDQPSAAPTMRDATVGTITSGKSAGPAYWRIRTGTDLGTDNWSGSPIVDSTGSVVGVYSRPTPPPPGRPAPETWILHDVADIDGLTAFGESWQ